MLTPIGRLVLLLSLCPSSIALCQDNAGTHGGKKSRPPLPESVQEFFLSDAVRNQDKGELQLSAGVDFRRHIHAVSLKMEYGVTRRLQFNFELPYGKTEEENSESSSRWSTLSVGVQYQLIRSESPFALSAGMAFGFPVRKGGEVEYQPAILAARSFRKAQVHASFGADLEGEESSYQYNLAAVYPVQHRWFPTLEFNGRYVHHRDAFYLTPGLYRRFEHDFEVGAGIPLGLGGAAGAVGIAGKISWSFGGK
jgi:hypothetical protein